MKKTVTIILVFLCFGSKAQTFDNVISRYVADSVFSVQIDSTGHEFVNVKPIAYNFKTITQIYLDQYNDFGNQPYQILPRRDSILPNSSRITLPAITGVTHSANCFFSLKGEGINEKMSVSITDINSNAYEASKLFVEKFRYWYFADKYNITIK